MSQPVQHSLEAELFWLQCQFVVSSRGELRFVNPDPQVSQDQGHGEEHEAEMRFAGAGVDSGLAHLAIAGFDAEAFSITIANVSRTAADSPGGKEQLLLETFAVLAVLVGAISDADRDRHLPLSILHGVRVPAGLLSFDPAQAGFGSSLFRPPPAEHDRHQERDFFLLKELDNRHVEESPVQQQTPDFQALFADLSQQTPHHDHRRFVATDPAQRQGISLAVLNNASRGVGMKLLRSLPRLPIVNLVATFVRLAVVGIQMPVDRHLPRVAAHRPRQPAGQSFVQTPLQNPRRSKLRSDAPPNPAASWASRRSGP